MTLSFAHKELIKLLAAEAVEEFLEEQQTEEKPAGVNAVVDRVEGMKATAWLKLYGERG